MTMFLFCGKGPFALAYFIVPDNEGEQIHHQYGCGACLQFEITGRVEQVPDEIAVRLASLLGCDYASPAVIKSQTGLDVAEVLDEALARLTDGRYIATHNCD